MEKIKNPWRKIIFGARPVEEEDDQLVLTAAMKLIRKLTQVITLTFQIVIHLSDRKCRHLRPKHVDVHLEITEIMQLYYKN